MAEDEKKVEEIVDRKLGFFIEHLNDQFSKVLEAVESSTSKIPRMSERLEKIESDISTMKIANISVSHDLRLIKIRSEKFEGVADQLKNHESRLAGLENAA